MAFSRLKRFFVKLLLPVSLAGAMAWPLQAQQAPLQNPTAIEMQNPDYLRALIANYLSSKSRPSWTYEKPTASDVIAQDFLTRATGTRGGMTTPYNDRKAGITYWMSNGSFLQLTQADALYRGEIRCIKTPNGYKQLSQVNSGSEELFATMLGHINAVHLQADPRIMIVSREQTQMELQYACEWSANSHP